MENLMEEAEEAAHNKDMKILYKITKQTNPDQDLKGEITKYIKQTEK